MSKVDSSGVTKWIIFGTTFLGLLTAVVVLATRYLEFEKARTELMRTSPDTRPLTVSNPQTAPTSRSGQDGSTSNTTFQPRSTPSEVLAVGHGKLEIVARTVAENRVVISVVGREFGDDYSPLSSWLAQSGDAFKRKLEQLAAGAGTWNLVGEAKGFTVRDGQAHLEVTFQRQ